MPRREPFRLGHAAAKDWQLACEKVVAALLPLPDDASLGLVYFSDHFAAHARDIVGLLARETGVPHWVGSTAVGVCATGREYFDEPAIVALVADVPADSFALFDLDPDDLDAYVAAQRGWLARTPARFGIAHGNPVGADSVDLLPRLAEATEAFLVGGLASGRHSLPRVAGGLAEHALSGVLFSSDIAVATGLTQGCTPLGPSHEVTSCTGNVIVTLDGRPAVTVLEEDVGERLAHELERLGGYVFAAFPVAGADQSDYLVRNLTGLDLERGLVAVGEFVEPGQTMMFCRRDADSARKDLARMVGRLRERAGSDIRGALYCSCVARGPNMFGAGSAELKIVAEALGAVPLAGFFGNGEFSHNRLYTYSGVLTLFL